MLKLSEFCNMGSGGTPSRGNADFYTNGVIPWVKSGELRENLILDTSEKITEEAIQKSSAKIVPKGSLLLAMYGATVGRLAFLGIDAATNQAVCNIQPDESIAYPKYLYYALLNKVPEFLNMAAGGAQPNISQTLIKDTKISLPSLEEQKNIAAILDNADALRRKRQQAIDLTDQLLRSVFLDMFGDPVTNPKGWCLHPFSSCVKQIIGGWSSNSIGRPANSNEYGVLKISSVTSGEFKPSENKAVENIPDGKKIIIPQQGDLLFSRANTRELVAAMCIVNINVEKLFLPDKLWRIDLNKTIATNEYIKCLFSHSEFKNRLCKKATGTSGSMLNISKGKLIEHILPLPPISLQKEFSNIYRKLQYERKQYYLALDYTESLFVSLSQRLFSGKLTKQTETA